MKSPKALIICVSIHHGNTLKVAQAMAEILNAQIVTPGDVTEEMLVDYDLIGFGSGIYNQKHHVSLFSLIGRLASQDCRQAFIFSTNTFGLKMPHKPLKEKLTEKGFDVIGEFSCPGFIDYSFIKYLFGGLSQGRPNDSDLEKARVFAKSLLQD